MYAPDLPILFYLLALPEANDGVGWVSSSKQMSTAMASKASWRSYTNHATAATVNPIQHELLTNNGIR